MRLYRSYYILERRTSGAEGLGDYIYKAPGR